MMKNLANCKPSEFFAQTVKIRKNVAEWLTLTDLLEIRKNKPVFDENATEEEKKKILAKQVQQNLADMFDSIFEKNAEKTLELLALLCFVEPQDVDDYEVKDYLQSFSELISCPEVIAFFTSLVRLENLNSFGVVKR